MIRALIISSVLFLLFTAGSASAQGFVSPFVGTTVTAPTSLGSHTKPGYGVALGGIGKVVGAETEIAFFPELIDNTANGIAKNKVITFSGDTLIGPMLGNVKPYFAIGAGNLHLNVTQISNVVVPNPESISNNYFTFNTGGGVMGFFNHHIGVRGDLRYTKAFGFKIADLQSAGLALDKFNYWRVAFGLAVKF